jgi:P-type Ca2+ transporter type 2C
MEKAFKQLGDRYLAHTENLHSDWKLLKEYPLSPNLLAMSHVWQSADGKQYEIAAKGAPEAIAYVNIFSFANGECSLIYLNDRLRMGHPVYTVRTFCILERVFLNLVCG